MFQLIIILAGLVAILLIFIVLIQNPKGGGISSGFSSGNQILGVKGTNAFVEKATWGLAIALLTLTLLSNVFLSSKTTITDNEPLINQKLDELPEGTPVVPNANTQQNQGNLNDNSKAEDQEATPLN